VSRKILVGGVAMAMALLATLGAGLVGANGHAAQAQVGKAAPELSVTELHDQSPITLATLRGRPAVVNFFSTWCEGCRAEHQALQQAARSSVDRPRFVGIAEDEDPQAVQRFLEEHGTAYPVAVDPQSSAASAWGVAGLPHTFFLDARGVVVASHTGPLDDRTLAELLKSLIGG
jgi:cytochrome c biogenesis protein CcmG/thiol:disulfide interchange protein DsbE